MGGIQKQGEQVSVQQQNLQNTENRSDHNNRHKIGEQ